MAKREQVQIKPKPVGVNSAKVLSLVEVARLSAAARQAGQKVVQCHGVFDLLHIGHIWHLQEAKSKGDILVVTLTPDRFVNKGPHRPAFSEQLRAQALAALTLVDYVAINEGPVATEAIKLIQPSYYVKGPDYRDANQDRTGKIVEEEAAVKAGGGEIWFTSGQTFSSTKLINQRLTPQSQSAGEFLDQIREKYSIAEIVRHIESLQQLDVLIIGEIIIDEYQYCEAIGKSSKEPTLVVKLNGKDTFAGGVLNIGNHAADFAKSVAVVGQWGEMGPDPTRLPGVVSDKIRGEWLVRGGAPTIVKRRYVDRYFFSKLFETYEINDAALSDEDETRLLEKLSQELSRHDVVIAADYGHGFFTPKVAQLVREQAKYLAMNVQSNAGSLGYQSMKKYAGAPFFSVDETEIRLEARDRRGDLLSIGQRIADEVDTQLLIVTRGKRGCVCYVKGEQPLMAPAFAGKVRDRVGAGDAFLTLAAMAAAAKVPVDIMALLGNVAGALAVATVGNKTPVTRLALIRSVESLLS